ncbi:MAG: branched-chain amino acid ABC transporter permease [Bacillota bacterium]|nr:branched-chain amino acid ABC transporter permease [Bacillota bacterium]
MNYIKTAVIAVLLLVLFLIPQIATTYTTSVALNILMWIGMATSWLILAGFTGYISLGHGAFLGIGAYFVASYWQILPLPILILLSGIVCVFVAAIVGYPVLRVKGPYFVILTLGLSEFVKYSLIYYEVNIRGTVGRILLKTPSIEDLYYWILVICLLSIATAYLIKRSRFGLALMSVKDDEEVAEALGVNAALVKWKAFAISAFFPGMIGAVMAMRWTYIDPYTVFNPMMSFQVTIMAFLGGIAYLHGPIIGATMLTLLSQYLWARYPNFYMFALGVILIFVVMFLPQGLAGLISNMKLPVLLNKYKVENKSLTKEK